MIMKFEMILILVAVIGLPLSYGYGWHRAEQQCTKPDHQIISTQIGDILIRNKKLYAIDEVHTLVVDPVLLNQLSAKQSEPRSTPPKPEKKK